MTPSTIERASAVSVPPEHSRLDYLDATRAFALVLGVIFHASLSFMPIFMGWAVQDVSTSPVVGMFGTVSHSFRMDTFFLLAGFFSHLNFHRKGLSAFVRQRVLRIVIPFVVGWFILRPLIVSGWLMGSASLRGDYDFWAGLRGGWQSLRTLPAGMLHGTHLWFLYYLVMITVVILVTRALLISIDGGRGVLISRADRTMAWLADSRFCIPILAAPAAAAVWFMRFWAMDTPDQSLRPHIPVLLVYGGFFAFGWLLDRQRDLIPRFTQLTFRRWILAAICVAAVLQLSGIQTDLSHPYYHAAHVAFVLSYGLTMWVLVFLTMGVFRTVFQHPRAWVRYIADSSYWMYLIHLPIVVWLQVAFAEFPLNWSVKLAAISLITIAVSLITYDLFVRSTWLGSLLNGQRRSRVLWRSATPVQVG